MTRTYILAVLVLIAGACVYRMKSLKAQSELEAAKERIRLVEQQAVARPAAVAARAATPVPARNVVALKPVPEAAQPQAVQPAAPADSVVRVARLTKGTFTEVDGTIVYSADAQLDIGHGRLVSSPTGVMVSDLEQQHISGDLVIESADGTETRAETAYLVLDQAGTVTTPESTGAEKPDEPKQ
jgi:hypothetical protein